MNKEIKIGDEVIIINHFGFVQEQGIVSGITETHIGIYKQLTFSKTEVWYEKEKVKKITR